MADALSTLPNPSAADWLAGENAYSKGAGEQIDTDDGMIPTNKQDDFAQYLVSSAFVHCGDAWSYMGHALDSLIRGDFHSAVHLTYYSELRAAISLLASQGIYVGNGVNLAIQSSGNVEKIAGDRTHEAAWKLLSAWSEQHSSVALMSRLLRPAGLPLDQWTQNIGAPNINATLTELLNRMSLDLHSFSLDRARRNESSYSPTRMVVADTDLKLIADTVSRFWTMVEPLQHSGFPALDKLILEDILANEYGAFHVVVEDDGRVGGVDWSQWSSWLDSKLNIGDLEGFYVESLKQNPPKTRLTQIADISSVSENPSDFISGMLVRTTLLLRLATGSCADLTKESGVPSDFLWPWIDSLCVSRGLWEPGFSPEDTRDLWSDIENGHDLVSSTTASSVKRLLDSLGFEIVNITQAERVLAWNFPN